MTTFNVINSNEVCTKRIHLAQNSNYICVFVVCGRGSLHNRYSGRFFKFSTIFPLNVIVLEYLLIFIIFFTNISPAPRFRMGGTLSLRSSVPSWHVGDKFTFSGLCFH